MRVEPMRQIGITINSSVSSTTGEQLSCVCDVPKMLMDQIWGARSIQQMANGGIRLGHCVTNAPNVIQVAADSERAAPAPCQNPILSGRHRCVVDRAGAYLRLFCVIGSGAFYDDLGGGLDFSISTTRHK